MNIDGYTIFCDDIREETAGKSSLIGVYANTLVIHSEFPAVLPKFCLSVSVLLEPKIEEIEDFVLYVQLPGKDERAFEANVKLKEIAEQFIANNEITSDQGFVRIMANIILSPVAIDGPGFIKVRGDRPGKLIKLGSLRVVSAS